MRPLKDEDTASTLESDICGEIVKLLLVADGHGGAAVAQLCATVGLQYLVDVATALGDASEASLHAASVRTFEHLHERAVQLSNTAGATLTIAVWNESRGELTVAHAGDSAAILVEAASWTPLTEEHRLNDSAEERKRVQDLGFKLGRALSPSGVAGGPLRAWPGGLAVCRTIGDADCPVASPVPALRTISRDPSMWGEEGGAALIVCSDGVWDAWSSAQQPQEQVARYVRECSSAPQAAERVVAKATKSRGLRDDVTSAVAWLGSPSWASSPGRSLGSMGSLFRRLTTGSSPCSSPTSTPEASQPSSPLITPVASRTDLDRSFSPLNPTRPPPPSSLGRGHRHGSNESFSNEVINDTSSSGNPSPQLHVRSPASRTIYKVDA